MKQFKIWQAPVLAFFSTQFYRDLAGNGKGVGFLYLLCLLSVSCLIAPLQTYEQLRSFMQSEGAGFIEQFPAIKIENDRLSIDRPSPYYISAGDKVLVVFNTDPAGPSESESRSPVIVTSKAMRLSALNNATVPFDGIGKLEMGQRDLAGMMNLSCYLVPVISYIWGVVAAWVGHVIQALLYSLVALLLAKLIHVDCKYEGLLRISSVAVGNAVIISTIWQLLPLQFPFINAGGALLMLVVIAGGYTLFGTGANLSPATFVPVGQDSEE